MKTLLLALVACAPVLVQTVLAQTCASPTPIQITGPVNALSGPMTGTINLLISYTVPGNPPVVQSQLQVSVTAGAMSVCLPASSAVVASYSVPNPFPLTGTTRFTRFWAVPASGGPYTLYSGVETVIPSTPNLFVSWGQLPQPPSTGTYCLGAVTGTIGWNSCSGGSGSAVSSVFGRTGAVVAQSGDYAPAQVGLGNVTNNAQVVDPGANGIVVRTGAGASSAVPAPSGSVVGTTDTQALTNKTVDGVSPSVMAYLDASSSVQTQLNGKAASNASTTVWGTVCSLSGTCSPTLPNPSVTTLGGVESIASLVHSWIGYIDTSGVPHQSQPAFTDISGSLGHGQLPALLSGDIPNNAANTTGNAGSATALATLPTPCSVGQAPAGVLTSGNSTGCTAYVTGVTGSSGAASSGGATPNITVTANVRTRAIGYTFDGGGSALTSGVTKYLTVPFACTLSAWNIAVDTGTATVKTWKVATGTAVPTVSNSLSTSGVSIASGTAIHSATMSDFSSTTVSANDIFGFNLYAVATATQINFILECDQ